MRERNERKEAEGGREGGGRAKGQGGEGGRERISRFWRQKDLEIPAPPLLVQSRRVAFPFSVSFFMPVKSGESYILMGMRRS